MRVRYAVVFELPSGVDGKLLSEVRALPGIADADAGEIVLARSKVGEDWIPLALRRR